MIEYYVTPHNNIYIVSNFVYFLVYNGSTSKYSLWGRMETFKIDTSYIKKVDEKYMKLHFSLDKLLDLCYK